VCDVVCIHAQRVIHPIRSRDFALFIEEHREGVVAFLNVFFAFEPAVDFLCCDKQDRCATFFEFVVSRLKLSQLPVAVGSPGAADEDNDRALAAII
jgi:hypothetical protein